MKLDKKTAWRDYHPARYARDIKYAGAPKEKGRWLLRGYGRIRKSSSPNIAFEIYASFLRLNEDDWFQQGNKRPACWLELAAISIIPPGTVFENQKPVGFWKKLEFKEIKTYDNEEFSEKWRVDARGSYEKVNSFEPQLLQTTSNYSSRTIAMGGIEDNFDRAIISNIEFARFYLACTSELAYDMFSHPDINPSDQPSYSKPKTGKIDEKTFQIDPGESCRDFDHLMGLASILMNPDIKRLWKQVSSFYKADVINGHHFHTYSPSTIIRCDWPKNAEHLIVAGRKIKSPQTAKKTESRRSSGQDFEIYAILSDCRPKLFENLILHSVEYSAGTDENSIPTITTPKPSSTSNPTKLIKGGGGSNIQRPREIKISGPFPRFKYEKDIKTEVKYKKKKREVRKETDDDPRDLNSLSGGPPQGNSSKQQLTIRNKSETRKGQGIDQNESPPEPPTRILFSVPMPKALATDPFQLAKLKSPLSETLNATRTLRLGTMLRVGPNLFDGTHVDLYKMDPEWGPKAAITRKRHSRRALCCELNVGGRYIYVFDLEPKANRNSQICVLGKRGFGQLSESEKAKVLQTWTISLRNTKNSSNMWPDQLDYTDVISFGLDHTNNRVESFEYSRSAIQKAIELFAAI